MERNAKLALLDDLRAITAAAGSAIMRVYDSEFVVELKDDQSPLTEADRAAHELIVAALRGLEPALPILSEESAVEELVDRLIKGLHTVL